MALSLSEANCHLYGLGNPYRQQWAALGACLRPSYLKLRTKTAYTAGHPYNETHNALDNRSSREALLFFDLFVMFLFSCYSVYY